ncbi:MULTISPECIES: hypothetical protein [Thermus]|jgi:hypothetical protein|uniref:Uncharacterized protein n=3 Tax=Thermus TaxID=270 RepID=A0A0N0ZPI9_THESC|nr:MULTISPECIES: hypothetical protein [Thermus]KPD32670.1 hypothetical protein AN926_02080 [Thermus scotoductus]ADW20768.1 conserved hypothetical protein [Thermus scotoductus SA-01]ETN87825.1 hypothetical protein TNMX_10695 [Thermus sp. NMX2.A1]MBW6395757.1 hypothetical protein [Thermus brevis]UZX16053.1 hypothetical protein KQ693_03175 [Thermus sp. PS18]
MREDPAALFLEDEALTDGLTDEEAETLLSWLLDLAREASPSQLAHLRRLGHEITRLSRDYGLPVEELIGLVELAWGEADAPGLQA